MSKPNINIKGWVRVEGRGRDECCPLYNLENTIREFNCRTIKLTILTKSKYKFSDER